MNAKLNLWADIINPNTIIKTSIDSIWKIILLRLIILCYPENGSATNYCCVPDHKPG
jgi:hypothetical protein